MDNPVSRQEFRDETDKIYAKLNKHDRQISVLETVVENFKGLPSAINNLEKTMALMGQNLENLNTKVDVMINEKAEKSKEDEEQDRKIRELDEKSKVDIMVFVKDNWWKICVGIAGIIVFINEIAPNAVV